jgi:hypothetical protein
VKIKTVTSQFRNDFTAILECEHCNATQTLDTGYDDAYYHMAVLPSIHCDACKKDRKGLLPITENEAV